MTDSEEGSSIPEGNALPAYLDPNYPNADESERCVARCPPPPEDQPAQSVVLDSDGDGLTDIEEGSNDSDGGIHFQQRF